MKQQIKLVLERENSSEKLWGRITYKDELIVSSADNYESLVADFKQILQKFHHIDPEQIEFDLSYDLTALFKEKSFLNLTAVADRLGMNRSLLAQYAAGIKFPSLKTAVRIIRVIHGFGNELRSIKLAVKGVPFDYLEPSEVIDSDLEEESTADQAEHTRELVQQEG